MPSSTLPSKGMNNRFPMISVLTLAFWRLRQTWFLLLITTIGIVAAVVIVSVVPLFSDVMTTAGLRNTLKSSPDSAEIEVNAGTLGISTPIMHNVHDQFAGLLQQYLGSLAQPTQFSTVSTDFSFAQPWKNGRSLIMKGASMQDAASHLGRIQGRIARPVSQGNDIEVMLTSESAKLLGVKAGGDIKLLLNFYTKLPNFSSSQSQPTQQAFPVTAHVVGIFNIDPANSAYWHGDTFKSVSYTQGKVIQYTFNMLVPNESLFTILEHVRSLTRTDAIYSTSFVYTMRWYYRINPSQVSIKNLDALIGNMANLQATYNADYGDLVGGNPDTVPTYPYLSSARLSSPMFSTQDTPGNLERFRNRVDVAQIPVAVLTMQIILLILFFVSLMTSLLVERQTETIALLRSRGASAGQIFGALLTQCIGMSIFAIIIGVPLAVFTVIWLSPRILSIGGQDALNFITANLSSIMQSTALYAVGIVVVVLATMSVSLFLVARMDVLAIRRDAARTNKRPLWQRLNLDVIAGVVALVGYGLSFYLTSIGNVLQGDAKTLITTPLSIIAPFFLVIGCMFLFLRIFPLLLRLAAFLSARGRGAVSMLALAQVARSPRQSIRMTMLLALAIAFALFTLTYTATQAQHIQDVTTYQVGADFSGELPSVAGGNAVLDPVKTTNSYRAIPGVTSASVGYVGSGEGGNANLTMAIRAVDANTFGRTVIWPSQTVSRSANALLKKLAADRKMAVENDFVPAIVDATTLSVLQLHVGDVFTIKVDGLEQRNMHCGIIGVVSHIPTVNDRTAPAGADSNKGFLVVGGVLVDYQTYASVYVKDAKKSNNLFQLDTPSINHVWLSTNDDATSLASVRTALSKSDVRLTNITDRRELLISLKSDPLYVVLGGVLGIGTVTALLLALVGDLLASWLSARTRLTNFAILRALGTTPQQVASMLTWEQAIVYITGLLLGVGFGFLLSMTVIPSLTFTNLNADLSNSQFYALQTALPTQVVLPPTLPLALLILAAIYIVALTMMVRVVSQPSLSQTLRLNED